MNSISLKAYAKINLGLDVLGTLPDGYHEVKMVMQSISLYDKVNIKKNDSGTINVKTNLSYLCTSFEEKHIICVYPLSVGLIRLIIFVLVRYYQV